MSKSIVEETFEIAHKVNEAGRLRKSGRYDEAINILKAMRQDHKAAYENEVTTRRYIEEQIATTLAEKALKLSVQGKLREASSLWEDIFENSFDKLGEPVQINYRNIAALHFSESGEYSKSYIMFKENASRQAKLLGPSDIATLSTQSHLARSLAKLERFEESLALFEVVLDKMKSKFGNDDFLTIRTQMNLAIVLLKTRATQRALKQFEDVFERRKRILGAEDYETLTAQKYMAKALIALDRLSEALNMITQVFNGMKGKLGSSHPDTLRSQSLIGLVLLRQAKYSEALKLLNEVHARQESILGNTYPHALATQSYIEALKIRVGQKKFADLQSSCKVNDDDDFTELISHIDSGDVSGMNDLLENGVDISRVTAMKGNTPLHIAVNKNNIDTIESLLKHAKKHLSSRELLNFIDARTTSAAGNTAMHIAASNGSLETLKVLLRFGATCNVKNRKGKTPRELAKDPEVESFLGVVENN